MNEPDPHDALNALEAPEAIHEARLWRDNGWTAQVIKNEDDDGWAVAMYQHGQAEPALVGPWTMGRDKKNPKPLDTAAFNTLVKTAAEVIRRHEQHVQAQLHQHISIDHGGRRFDIRLDIVPDEIEPYAELSAEDDAGDELARLKVSAGFRLNRASATAWVASGFARP